MQPFIQKFFNKLDWGHLSEHIIEGTPEKKVIREEKNVKISDFHQENLTRPLKMVTAVVGAFIPLIGPVLSVLMIVWIVLDIIDIKDSLINEGMKSGIDTAIEKTINVGKNLIGIINGDFKNISARFA